MIKKSNIILDIVLLILLVDFLGFVAWTLSGQLPADGFFIGRITTEVLKLIFAN